MFPFSGKNKIPSSGKGKKEREKGKRKRKKEKRVKERERERERERKITSETNGQLISLSTTTCTLSICHFHENARRRVFSLLCPRQRLHLLAHIIRTEATQTHGSFDSTSKSRVEHGLNTARLAHKYRQQRVGRLEQRVLLLEEVSRSCTLRS